MKKETKKYRKIWIENNGSIPLDEDGRSYEIHHIDGNRENNSIDNLICVSISEHYKIHYENGDYGACVLIAKRMGLSPDHLSKIQKGKKRPGIGGVKKGTIPWNKGISGYKLNLTEEGIKNRLKGVLNRKLSENDRLQIIEEYKKKPKINDERIGKTQKNGRIFPYERAFSYHYAKIYGVTQTHIFKLIKEYNV